MSGKQLSRGTVFFLVIMAAVSLSAIPATAENTQSDSEWGQAPGGSANIDAGMYQEMGPLMGGMMENMMAGMFNVFSRPEVAEHLASFTRNYYEALIRKGFTPEEALRIVASVGIPSVGK